MMAKAKEGRTIPCGEFERKISLVWPVEVSRMKQNGGNFRVQGEGPLAKYTVGYKRWSSIEMTQHTSPLRVV